MFGKVEIGNMTDPAQIARGLDPNSLEWKMLMSRYPKWRSVFGDYRDANLAVRAELEKMDG